MPTETNLGKGCARFTAFGCGGLLTLFGATMLGGAALTLGEKHSITGELVMMFFFGVVPLVVGVTWIWRTVAARRREAWEAIERKVLTLAMQRGGVITAMEVAADTDLSFEEAGRYLDRLADRGHIEVTPSDRGLAYRFPGAATNPATDIRFTAPPETSHSGDQETA